MMNNFVNLDQNAISNVLNNAGYCNLATTHINTPYIVPMFYTFRQRGCIYVFYLESRMCGTKIENIRNNEKVALSFVSRGRNYIDSVVVQGCAEFVNCDNCNVVIKVKVLDITGRRYFC